MGGGLQIDGQGPFVGAPFPNKHGRKVNRHGRRRGQGGGHGTAVGLQRGEIGALGKQVKAGQRGLDRHVRGVGLADPCGKILMLRCQAALVFPCLEPAFGDFLVGRVAGEILFHKLVGDGVFVGLGRIQAHHTGDQGWQAPAAGTRRHQETVIQSQRFAIGLLGAVGVPIALPDAGLMQDGGNQLQGQLDGQPSACHKKQDKRNRQHQQRRCQPAGIVQQREQPEAERYGQRRCGPDSECDMF